MWFMHAVIRHYRFDPKDSKEIAEKLTNGFMPIMSKAKGYVRYYWLDNGKGEGASISVFDSREEAEASVPLAAEWVHENFTAPQIMKQKPEVIEGTVVVDD
jgi:hypothetical protein